MLSQPLFADQCPTPDIIKERNISRDYEWTLDERMTLDDVLSVEKLYSVRIKNKGEFIACYYSGSKGLLRLDGKPEKDDCGISKGAGSWEVANNGEEICKEQDLTLCMHDIICPEQGKGNE